VLVDLINVKDSSHPITAGVTEAKSLDPGSGCGPKPELKRAICERKQIRGKSRACPAGSFRLNVGTSKPMAGMSLGPPNFAERGLGCYLSKKIKHCGRKRPHPKEIGIDTFWAQAFGLFGPAEKKLWGKPGGVSRPGIMALRPWGMTQKKGQMAKKKLCLQAEKAVCKSDAQA